MASNQNQQTVQQKPEPEIIDLTIDPPQVQQAAEQGKQPEVVDLTINPVIRQSPQTPLPRDIYPLRKVYLPRPDISICGIVLRTPCSTRPRVRPQISTEGQNSAETRLTNQNPVSYSELSHPPNPTESREIPFDLHSVATEVIDPSELDQDLELLEEEEEVQIVENPQQSQN